MNKLLLIFLIISIINLCSCFKLQNNYNNINNLKATNTNRNDISDKEFKEVWKLGRSPSGDSKSEKKVGGKDSPKRWSEILSPIDLYPVAIDTAAVGWTLATQTLLLNMSFLAGYLFDQRLQTLSSLSFDWNSISLGLLFGTGLALLGSLVDTLPMFKDITRDTRMFTLRLLGRDTSPISALITASFLSIGAGVAEEAFFRGVIFTVVNSVIGLPGAFIISSAIFSLGHFPVWGANFVNEGFLGLVFCYCYWISGFNLVVPIVAHALYDLITIYTTWRSASSDMKERMSLALDEGFPNVEKELGEYTTTQIEKAVTKAVFDLIDLDGDGNINPKELRVGLRLFGLGQPIFNTPGMSKMTTQLFQEMDKNNDGKISFNEFSESLKSQGLFGQETVKKGQGSAAAAVGKKA